MAKITRFNEYVKESIEVTPLKDVTPLDLDDPKSIASIVFEPNKHYDYNGIIITFSHATSSHIEDERLRYSGVFGYNQHDAEGSPIGFDWLVYGKDEATVISELKKMIPVYMKSNPRPKEHALTESESEDEWRQLTKDEKIDRLNKKIEDAVKRKDLKDDDVKKIKERMDKELQRSGPDKIRQELMKRAKEEEDIKGTDDDSNNGGSGRVEKAKELVKQEVWKGYKQGVGQFFDTMYDLLAGD